MKMFITWNEVLSGISLGAAPGSAPASSLEGCARGEFLSMKHEGEHTAGAGGGASYSGAPQWLRLG